MTPDFTKEMQFLALAQKLKNELRHCWMDSGRQESVAEHSRRLSLMVMRYAGYLDKEVDILRCLKIALIHDLPESLSGDIAVFKQDAVTKKLKAERELTAMLRIKVELGDDNGDEIFALWHEYEESQSYEGRFVKALDKLEAFIQHNESPLETWENIEKEILFEDKYLRKYCAFDSFLAAFAEKVIEDGVKKLEAAGEDIEKIKRAVLAKDATIS